MPAQRAGHARVIFDAPAFHEDLQRTTDTGRSVALQTRSAYERDGCPVEDLIACDSEAQDGTRLQGCAKVYLPSPAGRFGMVFEINRQAGSLVLAYLAFGVRHHPRGSHALTVYQLAHQRLNGPDSPLDSPRLSS
jgi:hypothetical protein